jgi:phosphatidylglycerophosphatase A
VAWIKDHLHGGLAIMLDDAAAGLYTMMIILSGSKLYGYLT